MRLSFIAALFATAVVATSSPAAVTPDKLEYKDGVAIVEPLKSYVAKLECVGCPFVHRDVQAVNGTAAEPQRDNVLFLDFQVKFSTLLLNGDSIIPLGLIPPRVKAAQVPTDFLDAKSEEALAIRNSLINSTLQYEHSILQTKMANRWFLQFDVTALHFGHAIEPVKLDKQGQKLVQIIIAQKDPNDPELSIESLELVERKDKAQPFKMRCGKLAISTTSFDPNEWDQYGKLGTWPRTWNLVLNVLGDGLAAGVQKFLILAPLFFFVAFGLVIRRRWLQAQEHARTGRDEEAEAEFALLTSWDEDDFPPEYANVPVIKIEEYD